ncbi:YhdP family phospholipid transporter [Oceanospirillum sediminis]|uniref:YhdP central domain-containing protein n=1 Tax=Oceanospirillum sediminis TaxID=2760088 RepID=A0A839IMJ1_9GAMM|nr:AsmA-like C-terminal region-containing protein [Oceanospirillum sediminis]MBB1485732.1 hypothetical protein [Oceanospirillum sediminis]
MSLSRHIFHHSIGWLLLPLVVILALYLSIGRYLFPVLSDYREELLQLANQHLPMQVQVKNLSGQWNRFDPAVELEGIQLFSRYQTNNGTPSIEVDYFSLELDSLSSIRYQLPVIRQASIQGVTLRLQQQYDLTWRLQGWESAKTSGTEASRSNANNQQLSRANRQARQDVEPLARLLELLMAQQHLKMEFVWLEFYDRLGREYRAFSQRLEVYEKNGMQRIQGSLQLNPESAQKIEFIMELKGDPFNQKSLEIALYLKADQQSLTSWIEKIAHLLPVKVKELDAGLELWTQWKSGKLDTVKGNLSARSVRIQSQDMPEMHLRELSTDIFWDREKYVAPTPTKEVPASVISHQAKTGVTGSLPVALPENASASPGSKPDTATALAQSNHSDQTTQPVAPPSAMKFSGQQQANVATTESVSKDTLSENNPPPGPTVEIADLTRPPDAWQLILDRLSFIFQGQKFPMEQLIVKRNLNDQDWQLLLASLNLESLSQVMTQFDLPADAIDALRRLKPSGELKNLSATLSETEGFSIATELSKVSVQAYYGAPVLENIDGYLETDANKGYIRFTSEQFHMGFPVLYDQGWEFEQAQGRIDWVITDKIRVYGQHLELKRGSTHVAGEFDVLVHQNPEHDLFYLNVGVTDLEKEFGMTLVPGKVVNPELTEWLSKAVKTARVDEGGFIYDGSLMLNAINPEREMSTQLMLNIDKGELAFLPDWPTAQNIRTHLRVDGTEMKAQLLSGSYLGNNDITGNISLIDDAIGSRILLALDGSISPEKGWKVFTDTPLNKLIPESLLGWKLGGNALDISTRLDFPIDNRPGKGQILVRTSGNTLEIPELGTPLENIRGNVVYNLDKGLSVDKGQAHFLDGATAFSISTDIQDGSVLIKGSGEVPVKALNEWQPMPFSSWLSGIARYGFDLRLDTISQLSLTSDLQGVSIDLPAPFGKPIQQQSPLELNMSFSDTMNRFQVSTGKAIQAKGIWKSGTGQSGYATNIWLGDIPVVTAFPEQLTGRSDIIFHQQTLALEPWVAFARKEQARHALVESVTLSGQGAMPAINGSPMTETQAQNEQNSETGANRFHLETDRISYGSIHFDDLVLDAEQRHGEVSLNFASPQLQGAAHLTRDNLVVNLDTLIYQKQTDLQEVPDLLVLPDTLLPEQPDNQGRNTALDDVLSSDLPAINLRIKDLRYNKIIAEDLALSFKDQGREKTLTLNQMKQNSVTYTGVLNWKLPEQQGKPVQSEASIRIFGQNLAHAQQAFAIKPMLSSKQADISARLNWLGYPHDFSATTLSGRASLALGKGEFKQVDSAPALKLISLFNFGELIRRLQLDFSDIAGKGLSYDKVTGKLSILNGQGTLSEPLKVDGSATKFEISGDIDFVQETLNQELIVTLPVAETLPLAAFLAGAPQVGGTIYIAQKILGNLFDKVTRARYDVKGAWGDPEIELKRVF